jgi:hypothetical protein
MSSSLLKARFLPKNINFRSHPLKLFIRTMTQGKAIATVSGRTIAETDEYEVVEGNIYVRCPFVLAIDIC